MGSWTFKIHSNHTEGIMTAKERICQLDGWLLCMRETGRSRRGRSRGKRQWEEGRILQGEEPHVQRARSGRQHRARYVSVRAPPPQPQELSVFPKWGNKQKNLSLPHSFTQQTFSELWLCTKYRHCLFLRGTWGLTEENNSWGAPSNFLP